MPDRFYVWPDGKALELSGTTCIMGILNVTGDSFSDGGEWNDPFRARRHMQEMIKDGADIIDIGAESTRPGAVPLTQEEEALRLFRFLPSILKASEVPVSVDTYHWQTAETVLKAGAHIINDVKGLREDDGKMAKVCAAFDVPVVIVGSADARKFTGDVVDRVMNSFDLSLDVAFSNGIKEENVILDPGIGFNMNTKEAMEVLTRLDEFEEEFPFPMLVGASRKRFIGEVLNLPDPKDRDPATCAVHLWAKMVGAQIIRVHNVAMAAQTADIWDILDYGNYSDFTDD